MSRGPHSVDPPPPSPQLWEGGCWKEEGNFFQGGKGGELQFLQQKNKLKSETFNDKKHLQKKIFFSFIIKNSKWEILTKNIATFKRWDGVKDERP